MKSVRKSRVPIGLCLVAFLATQGLAAQTQSKEDELRQKYRQAAALLAEKKSADAKRLFLEIWTQNKTYDVAASLGQIEYAAHDYADAAQYLSFAVAHFPPHQSEKQLDGLKKWLLDCKKHVATYELLSNVNGATINVDGIDIGQTPLEAPLFVASGLHWVTVSLDGYKRAQRKLNGAEGTSEKLEVNLEPEAKPAPIAPPPAAAPAASTTWQPFQEPPSAAPKPNPWVLVGGGVLTVGGLVTGLVFNSKANNAGDSADGLLTKVGTTGCTAATKAQSADCAALTNDRTDHDRDRNLSTGAFIVGGAALVGTAVYWFWPRQSGSKSASEVRVDGGIGEVRVDGGIGNGTSWVSVRGSF